MPTAPGSNMLKRMKRRSQTTYNKSRPKLHDFYQSKTWRKLRAHYRREHPLCELCMTHGQITPGALVDHIIEIADGGSKLDSSNLQTLCKACHNRKTAASRGRGE